jgi:hypothetical protein
MTLFVHLTKATRAEKIRRNGINRLRRVDGESPRGVFAVPVTRNFYISHQWLRELKRGTGGPIVWVYFRVPDDAQVFVGHYGQSHRWMSADEAAAEFMKSEVREGWEVLIPTRIEPGQIHRIRELPQVIGWRYSPDAKGRRPCPCPYCQRKEYGGKKIRERLANE